MISTWKLQNNDMDFLIGHELVSHDSFCMVPDILQNGDEYFFPVFTSAEEMGEYGNAFSKVESHFLHAINLARNNEKDIRGIVINAFSEPFVVPMEICEIIAKMKSDLDEEEGEMDK